MFIVDAMSVFMKTFQLACRKGAYESGGHRTTQFMNDPPSRKKQVLLSCEQLSGAKVNKWVKVDQRRGTVVVTKGVSPAGRRGG